MAKEKKPKKIYTGSIHTVQDAKKYISESLAYWDGVGSQSAISLARFAEVWRQGAGDPEKKKMSILYTNINQNKNKIARYEKLRRNTDAIQSEIKMDTEELAALEVKYGKYVPHKSTKKTDVIE